MRKIQFLPTMLTLGSAVCGLASIAYASKFDFENPATESYFALSGWLIIAAMVFDALDGYVARLARSVSQFGAELDSLCDAVSFGAAPAFLLLRMGPGWQPRPLFHQVLACVAALYLVCTILRLARYNVETTPEPAGQKRFKGLPSPGAAGCLASLAILRGELADKWPNIDLAVPREFLMIWTTLGALMVALLMVSRVPYPHLTKQVLRTRWHFRHLIQFILFAFVIVLVRELALVLIFWLYGVGIPIRSYLLRTFHRETLPATPGLDDIRPQ